MILAGSGDLSFDELLDMFHALSPKAERSVKILTAFRVYDFDNDGCALCLTHALLPSPRPTPRRTCLAAADLGIADLTNLIKILTAKKREA